MKPWRTVQDVVDWRLCLGCGACATVCPQDRIALWDEVGEGIRPEVGAGDCGGCRACLDVCPAVKSEFPPASAVPSPVTGVDEAFVKEWGPITALWEGYATDETIRYQGSSGGVLTALGAYAIEVLGWPGVLHIAQDPEDPIRNRTVLSRDRAALMAGTGSRYAPASVANGLPLVEAQSGPCVIIGKPAEIAAVARARRQRPALDAKVGLTLSFFCAESPSTAGTVALLRRLDIDPAALSDLRYRGRGWPGHFAPTLKGEAGPRVRLTYQESWAFLQAHRPWAVHLWPDGSGELADVSCGDPWYEKPDGASPGFSLVVARTERGRAFVQGAVDAGYLSLTPAAPWKLARSQPGLLAKKGAVWGRRLALRALGLPVTELPGLDGRHCWKPLGMKEKLKATAGTLRRALGRGLWRRRPPDPGPRVAVKAAVVRGGRGCP